MDGWMDGWIGGGSEWGKQDVQVIAPYARTKNARCEEVTAKISIATKDASDYLVAVFFFFFFLRYVERVSQSGGGGGWGARR